MITNLIGAAVGFTGLAMHHPAITLIGIGIIAWGMIQDYTSEADRNA